MGCPPPGNLPDPGIELLLHWQVGSLLLAPPLKGQRSLTCCTGGMGGCGEGDSADLCSTCLLSQWSVRALPHRIDALLLTGDHPLKFNKPVAKNSFHPISSLSQQISSLSQPPYIWLLIGCLLNEECLLMVYVQIQYCRYLNINNCTNSVVIGMVVVKMKLS